MAIAACDHGQHVLQRGVQAERAGGGDAEHQPQAVGGQKADPVHLVGQPIRVFADDPGRVVAIGLAHAAGIRLAETDVAQPRIDVGDRGHRGERLADGQRALRGDALDNAQVLGIVVEDLEDAVAEPLDGLGRADGSQVQGVGDQEGDDSTPVEVIDELEGVDAHLPAVLGVADPDATDAHDGAQRHVRRQVTERADSSSVGLLEGEDGEAALIAEVHGHQRAAQVDLSASLRHRQGRGGHGRSYGAGRSSERRHAIAGKHERRGHRCPA